MGIWSGTPHVAPNLLKALAMLSYTTVRRSLGKWKDLKTYGRSENQKKGHISPGDQQAYYFSTTLLTTERRLIRH